MNKCYNMPMNLGISTASYFLNKYTEQAIVPIAKIGADACEIFFASHCEYTKEFGCVINEELKKANEIHPLYVHSIHALTNQYEPELYSLNDRAYNDALMVFKEICCIGEQVGAHNYSFHGATILKRAVKYTFNYDLIAKRINILCDIAKSHNITLCYENVHWAYFSTPEYFKKLKPLCPNVGTVLDIKQAMQSGYDYKEYLKVMGNALRTVHLCDYNSDGSLELPGRGTFDFVELFKRLQDQNFDGACLMEVYAKNYKDESELKESFDYLKLCLDKSKK